MNSCPLFSNSPSPTTRPHIFSDFSTSFLTSFFRGLRLLIIIEPPDGGVLTTCCRILSLLCNQIYQSPRRHLLTTYDFHHTHFLYFSKIFSKIFWALFWDPRGSCPLFSNSPSRATYPHIFSDVSPSFLTSFFTVVPKGLTAGSKVHVAVKLTTYYSSRSHVHVRQI